MNFRVNRQYRHRSSEWYDLLNSMNGYKCEYKFYKDRPVNEIEDTICEEEATSDSDVVEATETEEPSTTEDAPPKESDDRETVSELGYNFIQLEVT